MKTRTFGVCAVLVLGSLVAGAAWQENPPRTDPVPQQDEKAEDPVCHMMVRPNRELSVEFEGQVYYFCMKRDLEAFEKDPRKYLAGGRHDHPDPAVTPPAG